MNKIQLKKINKIQKGKKTWINSALLKTLTICKDCWVILCISVNFTKCTLDFGFFTVLASKRQIIKRTYTIMAQMKVTLTEWKKSATIFGTFINQELLFGMTHARRSRPRKRQSMDWFTYESLYNSKDWWKEQAGMEESEHSTSPNER